MVVKKGWLVNDCLTCIPNTKTFWHDLLEWFPKLEDKTGGYTDYKVLADKIEKEALIDTSLFYIIRNATFFRKLNLSCNQLVLLQDCYEDYVLRSNQIDVCNSSDVVVFNSNFTYEQYKNDIIHSNIKIIPLGIDFDLFNTYNIEYSDILPNSILFVGLIS